MLERHLLEALDHLGGLLAAVGLDEPDDDVLAARAAPVRLAEHGEGLADAGRIAEEDLETAALAQCPERVRLFEGLVRRHHGVPAAAVDELPAPRRERG